MNMNSHACLYQHIDLRSFVVAARACPTVRHILPREHTTAAPLVREIGNPRTMHAPRRNEGVASLAAAPALAPHPDNGPSSGGLGPLVWKPQ
jgi:hypothetical protein